MIRERNIMKSINTAYYRLPVLKSDLEKLKKNLDIYIKSEKKNEGEENHKGLVKDFLCNTWYSPDYSVNTNGREDLVIFNGNDTSAKPSVIFEAKSPSNKNEMFSFEKPNCKALQECIYYFLQETIKFENWEIKHIIITDYDNFFIFDAKDFSRFFISKTNHIIDQFRKFDAKQLTDTKTSFFYENCAKPAIENWIEQEEVFVTHFKPKDFYEKSDDELIPLYKILSPEHLLGKPFSNDSNTLDKNFYAELLHILGLEEVKEGGKKIIKRKSVEKRDGASLIENAMFQLEERVFNENECFETALRLCITWVNRLLFLKLVESQQLLYQNGNPDYKFLTSKMIPDFAELNILFFKVLGRKSEDRDKSINEKFKLVPYLNSSLFELCEEETLLQIRGLQNNPLPLFKQTVLKDKNGKRLTGEKDILTYIFEFLDAYNFSSDGSCGITESNKTLINASVLGLIFEKINGYKDGSFFTPGFITEYMAKETVERAVVQKFNEVKKWKCETLDDVKNEIEDRKEANAIINSLRICDPAVGSGHFLVSVLNRILFIKSFLNILQDKDGNKIKRNEWEILLNNDEISLIDEDGDSFIYNAANSELQRIQEAIFNEKRIIIENCLFGVDINPASVYICRLRLWIELLKNAYYTKESNYTQLETLPNIDINIKCGNSLISKYITKVGTSLIDLVKSDETKSNEFKKIIQDYKNAVNAYKNECNKENKREVNKTISKIKNKMHSAIQLDLFDEELNKKALAEDIYRNSMEWMIEFPEVLDNTGKFIGFDAVIANPPYIDSESMTNHGLEPERKLLQKEFPNLAGNWDIYMAFFELALVLGKIIAFITPDKWLSKPFGKKFREHHMKNRLSLIVKIGNKAFESATVDAIISLFTQYSDNIQTALFNEANTVEIIASENISSLEEPFLIDFMFSKNSKFIKKIDSIGNKIINIAECENACATSDFYIVKNLIEENKHPDLKEYYRLINTGTIGKYYDKWDAKEISYGGKYSNPVVSKKKFEESLGKSYISRAAKPKIIFKGLNLLDGCLDENAEILPGKSTIVICSADINILKFLLGILNSKLPIFYIKEKYSSSTYCGGITFSKDMINNFPIPSASPAQQQKFVDLVDKILAVKKEAPEADTSKLESKIDELVYKLYDLNEEEIAIIENMS